MLGCGGQSLTGALTRGTNFPRTSQTPACTPRRTWVSAGIVPPPGLSSGSMQRGMEVQMVRSSPWVRQLRPVGPMEDITPTCLPETWQKAVAALGEGPALWAVELGRALSPLAVRPDLPASRLQDAAEAARPTAEAVVLNALIALAEGSRPATDVPPETALQFAAAVRQGVPLEYILEHESGSHALVGEALIREFKRLAPAGDQAEGLVELSRFLVDFVSGFATASSAAFAAAEQAWLSSVDHGRTQIVRGLLNGDVDDADAERRLSYEVLNRVHVGLVVFQRGSRRIDLDRVAAQALTQWGAKRHLIVPAGDGAVWAWGSFLDAAMTSRDLQQTPSQEAVVAVGRPLAGSDGFRRTHQEAVVAEGVARMTIPSPSPLVRFEDVRLISLLTADPSAAKSFIRDELGRLGDAREAHLRETVRVYLECNCSPATAAARLNVVKNTVVYRIRRAEELLGHPVKERLSILWVALHLAEFIGLRPEKEPGHRDEVAAFQSG